MNTKVEILRKKDKHSFVYKVTPAQIGKKPFAIPVIDVRDGEEERKLVGAMLKQNNIQRGSRYMGTSYSVSGHSYQSKIIK